MDFRAVLFVPALVGAVVIGFIFLLYAAHYFLTVLESTGAGAREVTWISEPILDNCWKVWYLVWLVGLWFGPAYFLGRAMTIGTDLPVLRLVIALGVIWLSYPVSQLSSLSASTIWLPLVPDVVLRLIQKPGVTFGFYMFSAGVLGLFGLGFQWVFLTADEWHLLFIGAILLVVSILLYARLLGRLAFALRFTRGVIAKKTSKPKPRAKSKRSNEEVIPTIGQPEDLPPIKTVDGDLVGYNILVEDDRNKSHRKRLKAELVDPEADRESLYAITYDFEPRVTDFMENDDEDSPPRPYQLDALGDASLVEPRAVLHQPRPDELALLSRHDAPRKPKHVWDLSLLAFLVQPRTIVVICFASGLCMFTGTFVRLARLFNPAAGS